MFGLQMLDVVIGVVFIYLLLSLVCSAIGEMIEILWKRRPKDLERSIREIFKDKDKKKDKKNETSLTKAFYEHPLIRGFFEDNYEPDKTKRNLPSYIPASEFTLALMDMVVTPLITTDPSKANITKPEKNKSILSLGLLAEAIKPEQEQPLQQSQDDKSKLSNKPDLSVIKAVLRPLVYGANNIKEAQKNIENWYNNTMERVTGWYKRHAQMIVLITAFIVTIIVNVDTIAVADRLWRDDTLRNAIVAQAKEYRKQSEPSQRTAKQSASSKETVKQPAPRDSNDIKKLANEISSVRELGLPISWSYADLELAASKVKTCRFQIFTHSTGLAVVAIIWYMAFPHLVGWTITAFALTMGASFWFDFLKKLVNIRSTIKPEEKSSKEEPTPKKGGNSKTV
jgi:hypothetical protein